jgi:hypothetical protein
MAIEIAATVINELFNLRKYCRSIPTISGNTNLRKVAFFQKYILNVFAIFMKCLEGVKRIIVRFDYCIIVSSKRIGLKIILIFPK